MCDNDKHAILFVIWVNKKEKVVWYRLLDTILEVIILLAIFFFTQIRKLNKKLEKFALVLVLQNFLQLWPNLYDNKLECLSLSVMLTIFADKAEVFK